MITKNEIIEYLTEYHIDRKSQDFIYLLVGLFFALTINLIFYISLNKNENFLINVVGTNIGLIILSIIVHQISRHVLEHLMVTNISNYKRRDFIEMFRFFRFKKNKIKLIQADPYFTLEHESCKKVNTQITKLVKKLNNQELIFTLFNIIPEKDNKIKIFDHYKNNFENYQKLEKYVKSL